MGRALILCGIGLILAGLFYIAFQRFPFFSWMGRLPGDIHIQSGRTEFHFPIVTCLLLSIALTFFLWLARFFIR